VRVGVAVDNATMSFSVDLRYRNQVHELTVALPATTVSGEGDLAELVKRFQAGYERRYGKGSSSPRAPIEWVNLRLSSVAATRTWPEAPVETAAPIPITKALIGRKPIYNIETRRLEPTPVYQMEKLRPGHDIGGPALLVSYGTTLPLHSTQKLTVDRFGNMLITV
jgi:N-methylhydantoinase A